ncbi:MAG TPA: MerR family transcriptional regulator [Nocardioidaceae bacterium]|nr:MerR family transcriptional regulator [Nocardioidaceae bacterium]
MRISELAQHVGVPVTTVRYYERIGLLADPERTSSGYREYDDESATRLLFISRARRLGLNCDQVASLLPIWSGSNCTSAHDEVTRLIDDKKAEIAARIEELASFAAQLDAVRAELLAAPPPEACRTDLTCCVPLGPTGFEPSEGIQRKALPMVDR